LFCFLLVFLSFYLTTKSFDITWNFGFLLVRLWVLFFHILVESVIFTFKLNLYNMYIIWILHAIFPMWAWLTLFPFPLCQISSMELLSVKKLLHLYTIVDILVLLAANHSSSAKYFNFFCILSLVITANVFLFFPERSDDNKGSVWRIRSLWSQE
jgi:hypothetical protein